MIKHIPTNRISIRIATAIRREIASGALRAGDRLPAERAMVLRYGVSRVSVREAYRALQDAGVVAVRRGRAGGAFIMAPPASRIGESLALALQLGDAPDRQAREARMIEPLVAALAARHAAPDDLSLLRKLAEGPAPSARARRFQAHRLRFHMAVADCARNVVLSAAVASLAGFSGAAAGDEEVPGDYVDGIRRWHRVIVDAIAVRDEAEASRRMRAYLLWLDESGTARPVAPPPVLAARTTSAA